MHRRKFFAGTGAIFVSAPAVVRAASLMKLRGVVMPLPRNYYGFVDRLWRDALYRQEKLRGPALNHAIENGLLNHIATADLARYASKWGGVVP